MDKRKQKMMIGAGAAAVILLIGMVWFLSSHAKNNNGDKVYVEQVKNLMNSQFGSVSSYSGKVESQETWEIKKDMDKTISEMFVSVGDTVEEGTPLFAYDTRDISAQVDQAYLELEGISNEISALQQEIEDLQEEEKQAEDEAVKQNYKTQILELKTNLRQSEYNQTQKQAEIANYQKSMEQATVTSKVSGIVKEVNESGIDNYGSEKACVTVLAKGDYRVKGSLDEQSLYYSGLTVGQKVIVRSRVDESKTWAGEISAIDTEGQADQQSMYGPSSGGETTSKYPFYVTLDSSDGLILGQHVFIEPDFGQADVKEGIWLDAGYVVMEGDSTYVWTANSKNRIEKRVVELGEFDETLYRYEILSGLAEEDYIAWPLAGMYEGVKTVTDLSEVDETSPLYQPQEEMDISEDGMEVPETEVSE